MLHEEVKKYRELSRDTNPNTPISRIGGYLDGYEKALEQEPKTGHCKDCKWWKDSDGAFRRGIGAESQCPINRREVFEGSGYCYMYEPQERNGE